MNTRPQRRIKPDMMLALSLAVGLGVIVTTSVQAEELPYAGTAGLAGIEALCDGKDGRVYRSTGSGVEVTSAWREVRRILFPGSAKRTVQYEETSPRHVEKSASWGVVVGRETVMISVGRKW